MNGQCEQCGTQARQQDQFCGQCGAAIVDRSADDWVALAGASPTPQVPSPEPAAADEPIVTPDYSARPTNSEAAQSAIRPYWIAALLLAVIAGATAWTVWPVAPQAAQLGSGDDPAAAALPDPRAWQVGYADEFLSESLTMITKAPARQRDFPAAETTTVQRTLAEGSEISGRWVRGHDGEARWLRLAGGGYVWEGNLTTEGGEGSPIEINFSNNDYDFGPGIDHYIDQASAQARAGWERAERLSPAAREQYMAESEMRSTYVRIPNRRWHGLTVTAVGVHYESSSIYFRESVTIVQAAFRANGLMIDNDGNVPPTPEEGVTCSINAVGRDQDRRYGVTSLTCGV